METQHLVCVGCQQVFDFTKDEQDFYESKGFTPPKRCPACRAKRRAEKNRAEAGMPSGGYHGAAHF